MTKKQNKLVHLFKTKYLVLGIVLMISIGLIILVFNFKSSYRIQSKLIGYWNIELESSNWIRDSTYNLNGYILNFYKDSVRLPPVSSSITFNLNTKNKYIFEGNNEINEQVIEKYKRSYYKMLQEAKGTWSIISINPDSVFLNVPKNPLYGKYSIRFFIDRNGFLNMKNNIYKMELCNDSTQLICNKGGFLNRKDIERWE